MVGSVGRWGPQMSENRVSGFRECARKARDLLQPMVMASDGQAGLTPSCPPPALDALETAWNRLLTVDKTLELNEVEIRNQLSAAYDSLETASGLLRTVSSVEEWPDGWPARLAQARSLVFASGGSRKTVPPSRRSSSSTFRAVKADPGALDDAGSAPLIETSEVDLASLEEFGPELMALLEAEGAAEGQDRASWNILEVEVGLVGENNFFAGLSMDVSEGGLFVATYQPGAVGTRLMLSFVLPDGHTVTTPGEVRFLMDPRGDMPPGMGVAFVELSDQDHQAIRRFCKMRRPTYYETD